MEQREPSQPDPEKREAMLDPWVIDEIKRREKQREEEEEKKKQQPTIDAPPEYDPDKPDETDEERREREKKEEDKDRGVTIIDI